MKRTTITGAIVGGILAIIAGLGIGYKTAPNGTTVSVVQAIDTMDGDPTTPMNFSGMGWAISRQSRDSGTWYNPEPLMGQHGGDCSANINNALFPTHLVATYESMVYNCKNHLMTAINAGGYGLIYLQPDQLVDWSTGEAVVQFKLSTLRMSSRDWVDVWITPYDDQLSVPFDQGDVDLQGVPRRGIHVIMSAFNGKSTFRAYTIQNFVETEIDGCWWCVVDDYLPGGQSAAIQQTFRLSLASNHVRFGMLASNTSLPVNWIDKDIADPGFTRAVVQFGHHSYNPAKDNSGVPATWHWDDFQIVPAVPYTLINGDKRYVDNKSPATSFVSFPTPAPASASLRFTANGNNVQWSTNGTTWNNARIQPAQMNVDRMKTYWTPIPAGTTKVYLRGDGIPNGPFFAKDFTIMSLAGAPPPTTVTPTPPTNTPTPIATPPPPSVTPTPTATGVPPTPTPPGTTATPPTPLTTTPTTVPTATPTQPPPGGCNSAVYPPLPATQTVRGAPTACAVG